MVGIKRALYLPMYTNSSPECHRFRFFRLWRHASILLLTRATWRLVSSRYNPTTTVTMSVRMVRTAVVMPNAVDLRYRGPQLAQAMEGAVTSTGTISMINSGSGNSSSPSSAEWRL